MQTKPRTRVLISGDAPALGQSVRAVLEPFAFELQVCHSRRDLDAVMTDFHPNAVILATELLDQVSADLVKLIVAAEETTFLIAANTVRLDAANTALKVGFSDCLLAQDFAGDPEKLVTALQRAIDGRSRTTQLRNLVLALIQRNEELEAANQRLWHLSHTDELTGYFNRRYIVERLEAEFARSLRYGVPLSVVLVDLDHFKDINDQFGHLSGDRALCEIAEVMRNCLRDTDLAGRYGGEEFLLILTNTNLTGAEQFCNRLRTHLANSPIHALNESAFHITASFGIATVSPKSNTVTGILRTADLNLYAAKAQGRNRVVA